MLGRDIHWSNTSPPDRDGHEYIRFRNGRTSWRAIYLPNTRIQPLGG